VQKIVKRRNRFGKHSHYADDYVTLWGIIVVWASTALQLGGEDFWSDCCADRGYYSIKYRSYSYSVASL
jgi:hypothetical protein